MTGLLATFTIALWFIGLVGMLAYASNAPIEIVLAIFAVVLAGRIVEWFIS